MPWIYTCSRTVGDDGERAERMFCKIILHPVPIITMECVILSHGTGERIVVGTPEEYTTTVGEHTRMTELTFATLRSQA